MSLCCGEQRNKLLTVNMDYFMSEFVFDANEPELENCLKQTNNFKE